MKILVIGGTSGLGKIIADYYQATGIGRSNGYCYPEKFQEIESLSLDHDVIINCIPDRCQIDCLKDLVVKHNNLRKETYFITIGSLSYKINEQDHFKNILYSYSDELLFQDNTIKHTLINPAELFNSKNDRFFSRISEKDFLMVLDFLLTTIKLNLNVSLMDIHGKLIVR